MAEKQSIVVLGAGFGGLRAAVLIAKKIKNLNLANKYKVVLVDRNNYQTFTPTLYEAATTSKETANYFQIKEIITFPMAEVIKNLPIKFINSQVEGIDLINGDVHCKAFEVAHEELKFDYLVLALGSETNYFDIEGLKENSFALKTFIDALKIRDKILDLAALGKDIIKIVIGGGGSTGVELAGEIQEWLCQLKKEVGQCVSQVTIVEASSTILPGFHPKIVNKIQKRLKNLGVEVSVGDSIELIRPGKAILKSKREMSYDILIWTGGVKAVPLVATLPLKTEKRGRIEVAGEMECLPQSSNLKLYGKIYGIGDAVCFYDIVTGKPIPGVARAAISQANVAARNIIEQIKSIEFKNYKPRIKSYKPMDYPYIIPVGGKWAVAKFGPIVVSGLIGWVIKGLVELNYLISILPFWKALKIWLKGLRIFIQNDRLW